MIEYKCDNGKVYLNCSGTIDEVQADVATLICLVTEKSNKMFDVKNGFWLSLCDAINHAIENHIFENKKR